MQSDYTIKTIARIYNDFPQKFGIPRQSNLVTSLKAKIIFEPEFRNSDALRGLNDYSHIWLIWGFSENIRESWSPSVRPPRLGGNTRLGVFATRSPFRPNPIGLSSVRLEHIEMHSEYGPILYVSGADLMNHTPIFDIKPYLTFTDSHPDASNGFAGPIKDFTLNVECPPHLMVQIPEIHRQTVIDLLAQNPRPTYQNDPDRIYGFSFAGMEIRFKINGNTLSICDIEKSNKR